MKVIIFILFYCFLPITSTCQSTIADTTTARLLLNEAKTAHQGQDYAKAEILAQKAYSLLKGIEGNTAGLLAPIDYQLGRTLYALEKYEAADLHFEEAATLWNVQYPNGAICTGDAWHYAGRCKHAQDKYNDALALYSHALEVRKRIVPAAPCDLAESFHTLGNLFHGLGKYADAQSNFESALEYQTACSGAESLASVDVLKDLGMAQLRLGAYTSAIHTLERALQILQKKQPLELEQMGDTYYNLGSVYKSMKYYDEALSYFEQLLSMRKQLFGENHFNLAELYTEIGQYCLQKKDYTKALFYFEQCNNIMVANNATNTSNYAFVCSDFGRLYQATKDYPSAIFWFEQTVAIWRSHKPFINSQLASMLTYLVRARLLNGDVELAKKHCLEAIDIWNTLHHPFLPKGYVFLANIYQVEYNTTKQDSTLQICRSYYDKAIQQLKENLRIENDWITQKIDLATLIPVLEKSIQTELLYHQTHPTDVTVYEKIWQRSELMHGYQLMAATQESNARQFAGIPMTDLKADSTLSIQIVLLEEQRQALLTVKGKALVDPEVLAINHQIFEQQKKQEQLRHHFEQNYPDYYRLKYDHKTYSLAETQALLHSSQTLIEYFVGDSSIFIFVVQADKNQIYAVKKDFPLGEWVTQFRNGLHEYHTSSQKTPHLYQKTLQDYAFSAQQLYDRLLAPIASELKEELIIVSDGVLHGLPFEALLSAAPKDLSNFGTYPFLLRDHTVHYAYSATSLGFMMDKTYPKSDKGLLAFAPFYAENTPSSTPNTGDGRIFDGQLSPLPYSGTEVNKVKTYFPNRAVVQTGTTATKTRFQELAAGYQVLHLATHAKADKKAGTFSFMAFAPTGAPGDDGLLSVAELYHTFLYSDLVVLSACETGIGEIQQGEGIISLSRAFIYTGAKSIVASLWSVNDQSTMKIMDTFYSEMTKGTSKNQALSQSKRAYLKSHPGAASHPYFWASFVAIGDMRPLK
jgi:CHAT domain-containing protein/tetratricopeptide (TPR) repeat protein